MRSQLPFLLALTLPFVGCANEYAYAPTTNSSAVVSGRPAAEYPIPPEAPVGDARLVTFGIAAIHPEGTDERVRVNALHVRMIVANNSDVPWTVDTRDQHVVLSSAGESRAAYASSDGTPPPLVYVEPKSKHRVDLFFPTPQGMQSANKLPEFDVIWSVQTGTRTVTERTPFERLLVEPGVYGSDYYYTGGGPWGGPYWYDPWYPYGAFYGVYWGPEYRGRAPVIARPSGFDGYHGADGYRGGGRR